MPARLHLRREARLAFEVDRAPPGRSCRSRSPTGRSSPAGTCSSSGMPSFSRVKTIRSTNGAVLPASARSPPRGRPARPPTDTARRGNCGLRSSTMRGVRVVLGQHVRPGADRPPVEREVAPLVHAALRIELVRLHRHRREERHREPVHELRILALDPHAVGVPVDDLDPGERKAAQIDPRQALVARAELRLVLLHQTGVLGLQRVRELLQPDDVLAHVAEDRRVHARVREPLDLVDVVLGRELARAGLREVRERELALDLVLGKVEIERFPPASTANAGCG